MSNVLDKHQQSSRRLHWHRWVVSPTRLAIACNTADEVAKLCETARTIAHHLKRARDLVADDNLLAADEHLQKAYMNVQHCRHGIRSQAPLYACQIIGQLEKEIEALLVL